ncbi:MAG: NAD-dependent epimerase/dehydratase family protein [Chloroflexi bacterium]|nr:NAD-dependent epimerase/dehydratase family protein [Chloroflexota bacterium]
MKALVVGGTGPTGPHVVEGLLKRGYDVAVFHRGTHEMEFSGPVEHLHGDPHFEETIRETLGPRTFDVVVCMYGRLRVAAEVMKGRTPRFIGIGGARGYRALLHPDKSGPVGIPVPISEDSPLNLDPEFDRFSYLMVSAEQAVMKAHAEGGYNATIFRYPQVYGPRQLGPTDWCIIRRILDGRKRLIIPDGGLTLQTRGYCENMAHAVLLAVDKPEVAKSQIYNVVDDKIISLRERIELVSRVMNHEWEFVNMPGILARPSRPYSSGGFHSVLDNSKVKRELGYADVVPIEEAIRRTVEYYLANRPLPGGQEEQNLRDSFDYELEDRFMDEFLKASEVILSIPITREKRHHPYPHPKKPGELTDHRGR